jgi:hypothetical protein
MFCVKPAACAVGRCGFFQLVKCGTAAMQMCFCSWLDCRG